MLPVCIETDRCLSVEKLLNICNAQFSLQYSKLFYSLSQFCWMIQTKTSGHDKTEGFGCGHVGLQNELTPAPQ